MTDTPPPSDHALLEVRDLVVTFGGVCAVDAVSFQVAPGELHGLIGPNGAGKTTTLDAITGFVPHRGRVLFAERDLSSLPPHERARAGLARTFQSLELFDDLSVRENCDVGTSDRGFGRVVREAVGRSQARPPATDAAIELLDLTDVAERSPRELSLGHRKLVALARALALEPRLLLLDEPAAGLDTDESRVLGDRLLAVVASGVTVLLIDHDMGLVLGVSDRVTVLDFGRVLAVGTPVQVRADPNVVAAYLGALDSSTGAPERGGRVAR